MSITYTIDGVQVVAEPNDTILTSATRAGVEIPTLCFDSRTAIYGACGMATCLAVSLAVSLFKPNKGKVK